MKRWTSTLILAVAVAWGTVARAQQDNCDGCTHDSAERLWVDMDREVLTALSASPRAPLTANAQPRSLVQLMEVHGFSGSVVEFPHGFAFSNQLGQSFAMTLKGEFPAVANLSGENMAPIEGCRKLLHLTVVGPSGSAEMARVEGDVGPPESRIDGAVVKLLKKENKEDLDKPDKERVYHEHLLDYAPMHLVIEQDGVVLADVPIPDGYPCALRIFDVPDSAPGNEIVLIWASAGAHYMVGATVYAIE